MKEVLIAEYEQLGAVSDLMSAVFRRSMENTYGDEGRQVFLDEISLSSLQKRFFDQSTFYLCYQNDEIKGVLELENPSHIAFLFVAKEGEGTGTLLCTKLFEALKEGYVTVGAFSKAVSFYEGLGFKKVSEENSSDRMPFTLMAKWLS